MQPEKGLSNGVSLKWFHSTHLLFTLLSYMCSAAEAFGLTSPRVEQAACARGSSNVVFTTGPSQVPSAKCQEQRPKSKGWVDVLFLATLPMVLDV